MPPGRRIVPTPIGPNLSIIDLVDNHFNAYNAGRLREACKIFADKVCEPDVTVVLTISGAMTPAGLGYATVVPLIEAGLVDWIVSTGANLYHDIHYSLGMELFAISPQVDDVQLRDEKIIRIYDIVFDQSVLLDSDAFLRRVMVAPRFSSQRGGAENDHLTGKYVRGCHDKNSSRHRSIPYFS